MTYQLVLLKRFSVCIFYELWPLWVGVRIAVSQEQYFAACPLFWRRIQRNTRRVIYKPSFDGMCALRLKIWEVPTSDRNGWIALKWDASKIKRRRLFWKAARRHYQRWFWFNAAVTSSPSLFLRKKSLCVSSYLLLLNTTSVHCTLIWLFRFSFHWGDTVVYREHVSIPFIALHFALTQTCVKYLYRPIPPSLSRFCISPRDRTVVTAPKT